MHTYLLKMDEYNIYTNELIKKSIDIIIYLNLCRNQLICYFNRVKLHKVLGKA